MNILFKKCSPCYGDFAPLILRIVLGIIFLYHGYDKVFVKGHTAITGFMASLGLPLPSLMAFLVSYGELIGGILLILGVFTYWVTLMDIVIALVALFTVHFANGFSLANGGYEYILLILATSIALMISGPGKYSLDTHLSQKELPQ